MSRQYVKDDVSFPKVKYDLVTNNDEEEPQVPIGKSGKNPLWYRASGVLVGELFRGFALHGLIANLVVYLTEVMHESNASAASQVQVWWGVGKLLPVLGGYIADAWLGRFRTISVFAIVQYAGLVGVLVSTFLVGADGASSGQMAFLWFALYIECLGASGLLPNFPTFGADQFNEDDPKERALISTYFGVYQWVSSISGMLATTLTSSVQQNVGWSAGFGMPVVSHTLFMLAFFANTARYIKKACGGSPLKLFVKVLVSAAVKWRTPIPVDDVGQVSNEQELQLVCGDNAGQEHKVAKTTQGMRWLHKAAVRRGLGQDDHERWQCSVQQVEELKAVLRLIPLLVTAAVLGMVYAQSHSLFILQGTSMQHTIGSFTVPPASLYLFYDLTVILLIPLFNWCIEPALRRTCGWNTFRRVGCGYALGIIALLVAALVDTLRLRSAGRMSIFWQVPQYMLVGAMTVFGHVGMQQMAYEQAPESVRSLCAAVKHIMVGCGSLFAGWLTRLLQRITSSGDRPGWIAQDLNQGHLNYLFCVSAAIQSLGFVIYLYLAYTFQSLRTYEAGPKDVELSGLGRGVGSGPGSGSDSGSGLDMEARLLWAAEIGTMDGDVVERGREKYIHAQQDGEELSFATLNGGGTARQSVEMQGLQTGRS